MIVKYEDLWTSDDDLILVTANATVKNNGKLVMGRGGALELSRKRPDLPSLFGSAIRNLQDSKGRYGVIWELLPAQEYRQIYGIFQVKYNWWEKADKDLIRYSVERLMEHTEGVLSGMKISMNFPGIGNGKLTIDDVWKIVYPLPDNISLYIK